MLFKLLVRWLIRAFLTVAAVTLVTYVGDSAVYLLRGSPTGIVTVNRFMGIPLKGQKEEFDYLGAAPVPCAVAIFPHGDLAPCWRLRRNPNQWDNL